MKFTAKREPYYYVMNLGMMMFIIVSLAFALFSLPVASLNDRLNVVMTLVLAAVESKRLCAEQVCGLPS